MGKNALLEFEDFTKYIASPPAYGSLFSDVESGKAAKREKGRILIVLPVYREKDAAIAAHLRCLMSQSCRDFDVLLVYGQSDPFFRKFDTLMRVRHAHRKFDYGFAGAVYAGQKFAAKSDYEYAMWSDIDRMPVGEGYIGKMLEEAERSKADVVLADYAVAPADGKHGPPERKPEPTVLYSLFSTRVFSRIGCTFLPICMGADDAEYLARLLTFGEEKDVSWVRGGLLNKATYRSVFYRDLVVGRREKIFARFLPDLWLARMLSGRARAGMMKHFTYPYMYVNLFSSIFPDEGQEIKRLAGNGKIGKVVLGSLADKYFERKTVKLPENMEDGYWKIFTCPWKKYGTGQGASRLAPVRLGFLPWLASTAWLFTLGRALGKGRLGVDIELSGTGSLFQAFPIFLLMNEIDIIDYEKNEACRLERKQKRNVAWAFFSMWLAIACEFSSDWLRNRSGLGRGKGYKEILGYGST